MTIRVQKYRNAFGIEIHPERIQGCLQTDKVGGELLSIADEHFKTKERFVNSA